jgi:serine/threonine-protein kinase
MEHGLAVDIEKMKELKPGDVIGNCRIDRKVAQGGMGAVYRARQLSLDRVVAIKVLKPDLTQSEEVLQRFIREGKLLAQLDHRSIIKIHDVGNQDKNYFLVMEFVDGEDLHKIVKKNGPLSSKEVLKIAADVADGLHYAHSLGVIHRDIKPSNIIRAADGSVRITDFGIARLSSEDSLLTQEGTLVGTPVYMSPEQCRGTNLDTRSDLYNLGATLYTLVSAQQPFAGRNPTTLVHQILHENARPLDMVAPNVDPSLLALIKRLMAKHLGARFQTGQELVSAIKQISEKRTSGHVASRASTTANVNPTIQNGALLTVAFTCICILAVLDATEFWCRRTLDDYHRGP